MSSLEVRVIPESLLGAQPTAGYCSAEKGEVPARWLNWSFCLRFFEHTFVTHPQTLYRQALHDLQRYCFHIWVRDCVGPSGGESPKFDEICYSGVINAFLNIAMSLPFWIFATFTSTQTRSNRPWTCVSWFVHPHLSQSRLDDFRRMTWSFAAPCGRPCARPSAVPSRRTR